MEIQLKTTLIQPAIYEACYILNKLQAAGFTAYIVGGAVRDTLLEKSISDVDIATSAKPEQVMRVFNHCIPTGLQHGTVTVIERGNSYEITTYRAEEGYNDHRRPSEVVYVDDIEADLYRRDFTMNAMALSAELNVLDPFCGYKDVQSNVLRCVGNSKERFDEDALRMMRAVRFSTTYQLRPSLSLWRALHKQRQSLRYIAMERVSNELVKMLQSKQLERALSLLMRSELLTCTKEHLNLPAYYSLDMLASYKLQYIEHQACSCALLYIAAQVPIEQAAQDLRALKLSNEQRKMILSLIELINFVQEWKGTKTRELQEAWIGQLALYSASMIQLFLDELLCAVDEIKAKYLLHIHSSLKITSIKQLVIRGHDLMRWSNKSSGPWIKEMMHVIMVKVALGELENEKLAIQSYFNECYGGN